MYKDATDDYNIFLYFSCKGSSFLWNTQSLRIEWQKKLKEICVSLFGLP